MARRCKPHAPRGVTSVRTRLCGRARPRLHRACGGDLSRDPACQERRDASRRALGSWGAWGIQGADARRMSGLTMTSAECFAGQSQAETGRKHRHTPDKDQSMPPKQKSARYLVCRYRRAFEGEPAGANASRAKIRRPASGGASGQGPFLWRDASVPRHNLEQPSGNRARGPTFPGTVPASCCTGCADDVSVT